MLFFSVDLDLLYSETDSSKFNYVPEAHVEAIGQVWVEEVLSVSHDLPSHLDVVLVRIFFDALIVKDPVLIVFVDQAN